MLSQDTRFSIKLVCLSSGLTLSMLGKKKSADNIMTYFSSLFFSGYRLWHFMQIVSQGDSLQKKKKKKKKKCQSLFSGKYKKNIINLSSAEFAQKLVKVNKTDNNVNVSECEGGNWFPFIVPPHEIRHATTGHITLIPVWPVFVLPKLKGR